MEHRDRIIQTEDEENFLPVSVIYGPNGGGKSNVLEALHTLDAKVLRPLCATCDKTVVYESLDRIKLDTGRRSALFVRNGNEVELKGAFGKIKISEEISESLPMLSYLGITYKKMR